METGEICPCNEIGAQPGLSPWLRLSGSVDSLVLQLMARSPHEPRYWTLTISGVLLVKVPHVALMRTVLVPVSLSVLVELELPLQPITLPITRTSNSSGNMVLASLAFFRRILPINQRGTASENNPHPLPIAKEDVVAGVAVMVKLVVAVPPSVIAPLEGLKLHVIPTGSPVQA